MTAFVVFTMLAASTVRECEVFDVHGSAGPAFSRRSDNLRTERSWVLGLGVGADLNDCWRLPLRAELTGLTDTTGDERGVDAVLVRSWTSHLTLQLGASWAPIRNDLVALGIELLAGPDLRLTRVIYEIQGEDHTTTGRELLARIGGGAFFEVGRFRATLRGLGSVPRGRTLGFMTSAGLRF